MAFSTKNCPPNQPAPTHNLQEDKDRYDDDDVQMVLYAVRAMPASLLSAQVSQVGGEQG